MSYERLRVTYKKLVVTSPPSSYIGIDIDGMFGREEWERCMGNKKIPMLTKINLGDDYL